MKLCPIYPYEKSILKISMEQCKLKFSVKQHSQKKETHLYAYFGFSFSDSWQTHCTLRSKNERKPPPRPIARWPVVEYGGGVAFSGVGPGRRGRPSFGTKHQKQQRPACKGCGGKGG